jgi:hypothetical protein
MGAAQASPILDISGRIELTLAQRPAPDWTRVYITGLKANQVGATRIRLRHQSAIGSGETSDKTLFGLQRATFAMVGSAEG